MKLDRRLVLKGLAVSVPACGTTGTPEAGMLPVTPGCGADLSRTRAQTEGPYWKPSSPARARLVEAGVMAAPLVLQGFVVDRACRPIPGALVDLWHCDDKGVYDNTGFRYRGHLFTDGAGAYQIETIVPGEYPGRTRHFHVKVQSSGGPVLTTQLYFPGDPGNARDGIFDPALVMRVEGGAATFTFVLEGPAA